VRAVIALSLILIFAVVTVYLFSDLSNRCETCSQEQVTGSAGTTDTTGTTATGTTATATTGTTNTTGTVTATTAATNTTTVTATAAATGTTGTAAAAAKAAADKLAADAKAAADKTAADKAASDKAAADKQRETRASSAQDFAKQLLIMLGTLITSLTSFYFGSKPAEAAAAKSNPTPPTSAASPKLTGVNPPTVPKPSLSTQEFAASGSGLFSVNSASLRSKAISVTIDPAKVFANDTTVLFTAPGELPLGTWDLVVKTREGVEASLPNAITIT